MSRFLMPRVARAAAVAAACVLGACSGPQDDSTKEKLAALEDAVGELRNEIQANQEEILKQFKKVGGTQQTMLRRGVVIDPRKMEKAVMPGQLTTIRIGDAPSLGPLEAPIEVVEFGEFQCPLCIKSAGLLRALTEEYPGQVRVGFRHYPLTKHKQAVLAGQAAWAAQQQGKFWEMYDALFASRGKLDDDVIRGHAEAIGLDMEKFERDRTSQAATKTVFSDRRAGRDAGVRGTPTYYVDGRLVGGNAKDVRGAVDRALSRVKARAQASKGPPG